jgi:rare lipoprotein A
MLRRAAAVVAVLVLSALAFAQQLVDTGPAQAEAAPALEDRTPMPAAAPDQSGIASWYGPRFHGRRTASGEKFDQNALTAAHRTLPFGTRVRVFTDDGRSVDVRINDRGPHLKQRIIDLSRAAAEALGLGTRQAGTKPVRITVLPEAAPEASVSPAQIR